MDSATKALLASQLNNAGYFFSNERDDGSFERRRPPRERPVLADDFDADVEEVSPTVNFMGNTQSIDAFVYTVAFNNPEAIFWEGDPLEDSNEVRILVVPGGVRPHVFTGDMTAKQMLKTLTNLIRE